MRELKQALRTLLRTPGFAAAIIAALGLGIGATTAIFSVLDAVVLQPLPYQNPEELVMMWETDEAKSLDHEPISPVNFGDFRALSHVFEDVAAWWKPDVTYTRESNEPLSINTIEVSSNFLAVLGVSPVLGSGFPLEDVLFNREKAVLVSYRFWRDQLASDPDIAGKQISMNGQPHVVAGVMPEGFNYPGETDLWQRLQWDLALHSRGAHFMESVGRLKPGVTVEQAQAELNALMSRLESEFSRTNRDRGVHVTALAEEVVGFFRPALFALFGAVGVLLVIACMNVSNLLLVRATAKRREVAVRSALGASRTRIVRQFFAESFWLGTGGAALGVLLAFAGVRLLVANAPVAIPRMADVAIDARALGFVLGVTMLTTFAFGLIPAFSLSQSLEENLKEGSRGATGRRGGRIRNSLVIGEIALALMLLIGAGLLIRTVSALVREDPGVRSEDSVTAELLVPAASYPEWTLVEQFYSNLVDNLRLRRNVVAVGASNFLPLEAGWRVPYLVRGRPRPLQGEEPIAQHHSITEGYLQAMGIPLVAGRDFDERDTASSSGVVLINQSLARQQFPNEDPIGQTIVSFASAIGPLGIRLTEPDEHQIIGIVADVKNQSLRTAAEPAIYHTNRQFPFRSMHIVVQSRGDSSDAASTIRDAVHGIDPTLPVSNIRTIERVLSQQVDQPRFLMHLMTIFAALALGLACLGIYSLLSYDITQQKKEISVRMALGATPGTVLRFVLWRGMKLTVLGTIIGIGGALLAGRLISRLLYGVHYTDAITYVLVIASVTVVALLACVIPGRTASGLDPVVGLRSE